MFKIFCLSENTENGNDCNCHFEINWQRAWYRSEMKVFFVHIQHVQGAFIQGTFIMIGQLLRDLLPQPGKKSFALLMQK